MAVSGTVQYTIVDFSPTFYCLPNQALPLVRFDGNIFSMVLCTTVVVVAVMLGYDWWPCMVVNISVQYNGGFLPDIIPLTQSYYHWGTRLNIV